MALSAIRSAEVYASAVSRTPGPVSVSEKARVVSSCKTGDNGELLTVALDVYSEDTALIKEVMEILIIELSSQQRVSVHCKPRMSVRDCVLSVVYALPGVRGVRFWNFLAAALSGVSIRQV